MCLFLGHVSERESFFDYSIGNLSYAAINNGYLYNLPIFAHNISASQEVLNLCGSNQACIFDSTVTGSLTIGQATLNTFQANEQTIRIIGQ